MTHSGQQRREETARVPRSARQSACITWADVRPAPQRNRGHRRARVRPGPAQWRETRRGWIQILCGMAVPAAGRPV